MQAASSPSDRVMATARNARRLKGQRAVHAGAAAEDIVERAYLRHGCDLLGKRVRIGGGEIDLIFRRGDLLVFVEVKSSASHSRAIDSLLPAQLGRLAQAAACFAGQTAAYAHLDQRIDLAAVDGRGVVRVIPNITL